MMIIIMMMMMMMMILPQDTLAPLLHHSASVPLFRHHEIWLSGLVSLSAGVIRMGLKDSVLPLPRPLPGPHLDCHWAGVPGLTGLAAGDPGAVTWARRMTGAASGCPDPGARETSESDTCDVRSR